MSNVAGILRRATAIQSRELPPKLRHLARVLERAADLAVDAAEAIETGAAPGPQIDQIFDAVARVQSAVAAVKSARRRLEQQQQQQPAPARADARR